MNPDLLDMAATMFGEDATGNEKMLTFIGSSILNRLESGRISEFGGSIPEVTSKGYYAKINQNKPYTWAITGQFPDKQSEANFKKTLQIAGGLLGGKIERRKGEFFFTDDEMVKQKKAGFDFSQVESMGREGKYNALQYKRGEGKKVTFGDDGAISETKTLKKAIKKSEFDKAFAKARRAGAKTFNYEGKKYTTELK